MAGTLPHLQAGAVIKSGFLDKKSRRYRTYSRYWFVLRDNRLTYFYDAQVHRPVGRSQGPPRGVPASRPSHRAPRRTGTASTRRRAQHLYYPAGVVDLQSISKFEIKENRANGFRIYTNDRVISLIAPSATALTEWSVPVTPAPVARMRADPSASPCARVVGRSPPAGKWRSSSPTLTAARTAAASRHAARLA